MVAGAALNGSARAGRCVPPGGPLASNGAPFEWFRYLRLKKPIPSTIPVRVAQVRGPFSGHKQPLLAGAEPRFHQGTGFLSRRLKRAQHADSSETAEWRREDLGSGSRADNQGAERTSSARSASGEVSGPTECDL